MSGLMLLDENRDWVRPGLVLVAAGTFLLIYGETVGDLLNLWMGESNPTYSHGPLLLLVCGALAYKRNKARPLRLREKSEALSLLPVLGLSLTWLVAALAQVQIVQYLCLVFLLLALFHALFGADSFKVYGLPILLLLFSIPLWEIFSGLLQWLTIIFVELLLNVSGIPAVSDGITIEVPAGMFRVEESCSGLGQFIVAGAIAVIFADTLKLDFWKSLLVVSAALTVAVASNIIRVYAVVVAGQMTQMQHRLVTDHYTLGWILFGGLFFMFLFVAGKYLRFSHEFNAIPHVSLREERQPKYTLPKSFLVVAIPCLVALTGPLLLSMLDALAEAEEHAPITLPSRIGSWQRIDNPMRVWRTGFGGYDYSDNVHYSNNANNVQLIVYQYIKQRQGKEAVSDSNAAYDRATTELLGKGAINFGDAGHIGGVQERLFRQGYDKQLVWYWYQAAGLGTANPLFAKLLGVWGRLTNEPTVSVFIVASEANQSVDAARDRLKDFVDALSATALSQ